MGGRWVYHVNESLRMDLGLKSPLAFSEGMFTVVISCPAARNGFNGHFSMAAKAHQVNGGSCARGAPCPACQYATGSPSSGVDRTSWMALPIGSQSRDVFPSI